MVAGHLQQKKGYWYMVLNLHDQAGRRKTKWIATHLPVPGNRKRAEELLCEELATALGTTFEEIEAAIQDEFEGVPSGDAAQ